MKRKINLQLIGIAVLSIFVTMVIMFTFFYNVYKDQVKGDLRTTAVMMKNTEMFQKENQTGFH